MIEGADQAMTGGDDQVGFYRGASDAKMPEHGRFQLRCFPNNPAVTAIHHRGSSFCYLRLFWVLVLALILPFEPKKKGQLIYLLLV